MCIMVSDDEFYGICDACGAVMYEDEVDSNGQHFCEETEEWTPGGAHGFLSDVFGVTP